MSATIGTIDKLPGYKLRLRHCQQNCKLEAILAESLRPAVVPETRWQEGTHLGEVTSLAQLD